MWILLSKQQQWSVWRHLFPALAIKVTVLFSSFEHNQKMLGWMRTNHHIWGEPVPSATGVDDAAKSFSVTRCCHLWASWGIALSLAPQQSPWWSRMLSSLMASCSLFSTENDGALDQHQPKQKCFPHSQSIVSHTQILHLSWQTNSGWAYCSKILPVASR